MKKLIILLLPLAILAGCNKGTDSEVENLKLENERLRTESVTKDSTLNSFFTSYNEIEENLAMIKEKERLIRKAGEGDISPDAKNRITEDLTLIAELMEKNKQTIASLRKKVKESDVRISEFEKTIEILTKTIEDKDAEIIVLSNQLAEKNSELKELAGQIQLISSDLASQSETISKQDAELNKAYYVIGTERELQANGILTKEGGFVGIGKTRSLSKDFNAQYFTEIDIRRVTTIPVNAKTAKIITIHPSSSYNLIGDKSVERIEIVDYSNFWRSSKHLVIVVK
ncbi:MAG: hypothetical protein R6V49_03645 [Bacteroidales bacterium]